MTIHCKLEHGDIIAFNQESENVLADGIHGVLLGISESDSDRTCFIFRTGEDIVRFYLDKNRRPMTRLLMLLVSQLDKINDTELCIESVKEAREGQSRLNLSFRSPDDDDTVECGSAPYVLPAGASESNPRRIALVRSVLTYCIDDDGEQAEEQTQEEESSSESDGVRTEVPSTGGEVISSTVGDTLEHAPVVVDGLPGGCSTMTARDVRRVVLVRNWPIVLITLRRPRLNRNDYPDAKAYVLAELGNDPSHSGILSRNFVTKKERDAFIDGVEAARSVLGSCAVIEAFTQQEDIVAVLNVAEEIEL